MTILVIIIVLALIFDFINGFHDAANSIATVVSTKVLTPLQAVIWAAFFNFMAFFIFKDHGVANTIAKTVHKEFITLPVIISGLVAAIIWNLITWWKGIPSSSSHTLIGGFAGAAIAHAGLHSVDQQVIIKTTSFIVIAPLVGMIMAFIISMWFLNSFRKGIVPKLISIAVMTIVCWAVYGQMDMHPDRSKIKVEQKTATINGAEHNAFMVSVFDASTEEITKKWKEKMTSNKATISGTIEIIANDVVVKEISEKPVDIYAHIETAGDNKTKMTVGILQDTTWLSKTTNLAADTMAANMILDFSKKTTASAPLHLQLILAKENFKWILLTFILLVMGIFTLFLSSLNNAKSGSWFKRLQLLSSAAFSIGHGGNDAQKVMGIITAALIASGKIGSFEEMPTWVPLACYAAIALGTMSGGWKIVKTMGTRITKVTPFEGVAAETAGAITLFMAENLKIPVSTTHTIAGSIMGVGATKRLSAVRWGVTVNLLWAWILTIPVTAMLSAVIYAIYMSIF